MCNFIESGNTLNYSLKKEKCFLGKRSEINAMKWLILISFSQLSSFLPALNNEEKNQYPNPYSRGSQTFSQKGRMRLQCNLKGPELFLEGGGKNMCASEREARSPLRPGSRARSRALEALGLLMLSDAISALFWTIYNLFETFFYYFHSNILCIIFYTIVLYFIQL